MIKAATKMATNDPPIPNAPSQSSSYLSGNPSHHSVLKPVPILIEKKLAKENWHELNTRDHMALIFNDELVFQWITKLKKEINE